MPAKILFLNEKTYKLGIMIKKYDQGLYFENIYALIHVLKH